MGLYMTGCKQIQDQMYHNVHLSVGPLSHMHINGLTHEYLLPIYLHSTKRGIMGWRGTPAEEPYL